jgi:hypothetical protein
VVRYVHLPGSAVDTALLEDGGRFLLSPELRIAANCVNSYAERSRTASNEGEVKTPSPAEYERGRICKGSG